MPVAHRQVYIDDRRPHVRAHAVESRAITGKKITKVAGCWVRRVHPEEPTCN